MNVDCDLRCGLKKGDAQVGSGRYPGPPDLEGRGYDGWMAVPGLGVHSTVDGLSELPKLTDRLNVPPNPWQLLQGAKTGGGGAENLDRHNMGKERGGREEPIDSVSQQAGPVCSRTWKKHKININNNYCRYLCSLCYTYVAALGAGLAF